MKITIISSVMAALCISACSTTSVYEKQAEKARVQAIAVQKAAVNNMPSWYVNPPANDANAIYATGTAASASLSSAEANATNIALGKICNVLNSKATQTSNFFQRDVNGDTHEVSETVIKTRCETANITGYVVQSREVVVDPAGRARTYVLVALPLGLANTIATAQQSDRNRSNAVSRAASAFDTE